MQSSDQWMDNENHFSHTHHRWRSACDQMESLMGFARAPATTILRPPLTCASKKRVSGLRAKLSDDNDPLLQTAINSASLRFQETHRPGNLISFSEAFYQTYNGKIEPTICFFGFNCLMVLASLIIICRFCILWGPLLLFRLYRPLTVVNGERAIWAKAHWLFVYLLYSYMPITQVTLFARFYKENHGSNPPSPLVITLELSKEKNCMYTSAIQWHCLVSFIRESWFEFQLPTCYNTWIINKKKMSVALILN